MKELINGLLIAVCVYRYVMIMGLWSKYDVDSHHVGRHQYDVMV